jgi:hypothetical protein
MLRIIVVLRLGWTVSQAGAPGKSGRDPITPARVASGTKHDEA